MPEFCSRFTKAVQEIGPCRRALRRPQLERVCVKGIAVDDGDLAAFLPLAPQLRQFAITLHDFASPPTLLTELLARASSLETLELCGVWRQDRVRRSLPVEIIQSAADACFLTLRHVDLSGNSRMGYGTAVAELLARCPGLEALDVGHALAWELLELAAALRPHTGLRTLRLGPPHYDLDLAPVRETPLDMVSHFPNLTSLYAPKVATITTAAVPVALLASSCPHLVHLNLTTDFAQRTLQDNRRRLTDEDVPAFVSLRGLRHLGVGGYPGISAAGVRALAEGLPHLLRLNVACTGCDAPALAAVLDRCISLQELCVSYCPALSLMMVAELCSRSVSLQVLTARDLSAETRNDDSEAALQMDAAVASSHNTKAPPGSAVAYLRMGHLWLKPPGPNLPVVAVAAYFPKLRVLELEKWRMDEGCLDGLAPSCPALRRLGLLLTPLTSAEAVRRFIHYAPKLQQVEVHSPPASSNYAAWRDSVSELCLHHGVAFFDHPRSSHPSILYPDLTV